MKKEYLAIIDFPHYEPKTHPRMQLENRAAQFAPFSALEGLEESISNATFKNISK